MSGSVDFGKELVRLIREACSNQIERGIFITPNIEVDTSRIAPNVERNELTFITSASALQPGKECKTGIACSTTEFYYANQVGKPQSFSLHQIERVKADHNGKWNCYTYGDKVTVLLKDGKTHTLEECMIGLNSIKVANLLTFAAREAPSADLLSLTNSMSLSELPDELQLEYMEVLYNYAYLFDNNVDSVEYSALQSIAVRIGLGANVRNKLRDYLMNLENKRFRTGSLIMSCRNSMSYGSYEIFRFSLMQDTLYLREACKREGHWYDDPFVNSLQDILEISDEQIVIMIAAINVYKQAQKQNVELGQLRKEFDALLSNAAAKRIPQEALFCAGSVYNVDTYHGIRHERKLGRSITRQRELMLQAVVRNMQESVNNIAEDMNDLTLKLLEEIDEGNLRDKKLEAQSQEIQKIKYLMNQQMYFRRTTESAKLATLYNHLRSTIPSAFVTQLLPGQQELVKKCYISVSGEEYQIKQGLDYRQLNQLCRIRGITCDE